MTGKTHGVCRTCKGDTEWNEQSMKYDQYCTNPECKKAYVKIAKQRMIGKYGKVHLLNNPEMQKKMLSNRKISGKYKFEDGTEFEYVGSYEREFLVMLNTLMNWRSSDLISPSPHTYYYNYKNKADEEKNQGLKFYIPDFYIPSLNLEIEIKQQTSTNQKFNEINRVKEKLKDEVLNTNKNVNYIKINDNDFTPFFEFLLKVKQYVPTKEEAKKDMAEVVMEAITPFPDGDISIESSTKLNGLFHLSINNLDGKTVKPSIPNNYMTQNGYEDGKTKRVCFATSIDNCLRAFSQNCTGTKLFVHVPDGKYDLYSPTTSEVPDVDITSEIWITEPVKMKCVGQIEVIGDRGEDGLPYKYGNKTAELYDWNWKWIKKSTAFESSVDIVNEEAIYTEEDKYPVFIILMHSGTPLATLIKKVTKDDFSHACISFNSKLDPMYSFGNKNVDKMNLGFVTQNPRDKFYKIHRAFYHVYAMYVNKKVYSKMRKKLYYFIKNQDTMDYDFLNLFSVFLGRPSENSKKYFCSRFVMSVLSAGKDYDKVPSLYKPQDLSEFEDVSLVNKGYDFSKYDYRITERNLEKIQRGLYDEFAYESSVSSSINYSDKFEDVKNIVNTLTDSELKNICNGEFKNSPFVVYREVLKSGNDPVAFIDVYQLPAMKKNTAAIVIATKNNKKYRNKGYMTMLIERMFENIRIKHPEIDTLEWRTQTDNIASNKLAKKHGFTKSEKDTSSDKVKYSISLESFYRVTYDGEGIYDAFKKKVSKHEWINFLSSGGTKWFPKPSVDYTGSNISYFTEKGYQMFLDKTLPLFDKYLDSDKITTDIIRNKMDDKIIYRDDYQIVTEEYIFSNKDFTKNLDKWENGEANVLLITGVSRSGKTTLGGELSKKYNAELIELDMAENFNAYEWRDIHKIINKWFGTFHGKEYLESMKNDSSFTDFDNDKLSFYMSDAIKFIIKECNDNEDKRYIIEGLQLFNDCDPETLKGYPIIIKQTFMLKSFNRRSKKSWDLFKFYLKEEKMLNRFKKSFANESTVEDTNPHVIRTFGHYDDKHVYHACVELDNYDKPLRGRSEILIVKGDKVFLSFKSDSTYKVPGGSWNENENHMMAAIREAKEEVRINTKNVVYSGLRVEYEDKPCKWVKNNIDKDKWWYGYYSEIYVGEFDSNYKGKIDEEDKDDMVYSGRFYPIKSVYDKLTKEHKLALDEYIINNKIKVKNEVIDEIAQEGLISFVKDLVIDVSHNFKSWKSTLKLNDNKNNFVGQRSFTGIRIYNGMIEVRGINYTTLRNRITKYYTDKSIYNIFLPKYNILSYRRFERKQISRAQIKIDYLYTSEFFALELVTLFKELGKRFRDKTYLGIAAAIYKNSWLAKADDDTQKIPCLDITPANKLSLELKGYQKDFIMNYPKLKAHLNLNGYVLAFEQGLGKTITATALAECLKVDHVYIVCPNSLKENWAIEIRKYYKRYEEDPSLWRSEVFICNQKQIYFDENTTKFVITNIESIDKMYPYIMGGKNLLVIDESHNFRNLESKRTTQLLKLRDKLKCKDVLAMSGTPIKASPSEIAPILAMIDPTFTNEAALCFTKAFKLHETFGTSLVQTRFGKIMYRKEKDVLEGQLPGKFIDNFPVTISNRDRYILENVRNDVFERFGEIYADEKDDAFKLQDPFFEMTKKYSRRNEDFERFKRLIKLITTKEYWPHEIDKMFCETYMKNILERISSSEERKRYQMMINTYVRFKIHCLGIAQGEILPKYRRDMFIEMYEENKESFFDMIKNNTKKTLIFTQFKDVANHIYDDLNRNDIGSVLITGDVKNRLEVLTDFKENDSIRVLVATSQTIGTGVTLTEATQMFFFGPPWRDADFAQCSDRIHRIGQTDDVYIYTVVLDTGGQMNLSTRMESILSWSKRMTDSVIITTDDNDIDVATIKNVLTANESSLTLESFIIPENITTPEQLSKWMKANIKYNHTGTYKSAEEVLETKSGDCHDQSEFESKVFSKLKIPHGKIFMMEYKKWAHGGSTHTCVYFKRKNKFYWFENSWMNQAGIHGPYNSLKELRHDIRTHWNFSGGCDKIIFSSVKNVKPGMSLDEYVMGCLSNYDIYGPDPLGDRLANEVYSKLPNKKLYDEMICKDEENKLNVYKEIPTKYLDKLISYEEGFNYVKAIANYDIPKDILIEKRSVESPLGTNGKFKDLKFTKLGSSVFSQIEKDNASVRFEYVNDNGFEYWNLISNRDIRKGEVLTYDPNDGASFTDPNRL